jgi:hypothetical protein
MTQSTVAVAVAELVLLVLLLLVLLLVEQRVGLAAGSAGQDRLTCCHSSTSSAAP